MNVFFDKKYAVVPGFAMLLVPEIPLGVQISQAAGETVCRETRSYNSNIIDNRKRYGALLYV
jgi:hypothetical protein